MRRYQPLLLSSLTGRSAAPEMVIEFQPTHGGLAPVEGDLSSILPLMMAMGGAPMGMVGGPPPAMGGAPMGMLGGAPPAMFGRGPPVLLDGPAEGAADPLAASILGAMNQQVLQGVHEIAATHPAPPGAAACDADRARLCPPPNKLGPLHCMGEKHDELQPACVDFIGGTVPFACQKMVSQHCPDYHASQVVMQCLMAVEQDIEVADAPCHQAMRDTTAVLLKSHTHHVAARDKATGQALWKWSPGGMLQRFSAAVQQPLETVEDIFGGPKQAEDVRNGNSGGGNGGHGSSVLAGIGSLLQKGIQLVVFACVVAVLYYAFKMQRHARYRAKPLQFGPSSEMQNQDV